MIQEQYVSFEIAKLLKDKGFEQIGCKKRYNLEGDLVSGFAYGPVAPTQSIALKWLREVHNIYIEIRYMPSQFTDEPTYKAMIWNMDTEIGTPLSPNISYTYFETCIEAALKYTLENLI